MIVFWFLYWTLLALVAIYIVIGLFANEATLKDRLAIVNSWPPTDFLVFLEACQEMDAVPYDKHMRYRMTFRDPRKLYGPTTKRLMGWQ